MRKQLINHLHVLTSRALEDRQSTAAVEFFGDSFFLLNGNSTSNARAPQPHLRLVIRRYYFLIIHW